MKKIFIVFILIIIAVITVSLYAFLNKTANPMTRAEKEAALAKLLGRPVNLSRTGTPSGDVYYKGKYVTFMYPATAKIYTYRDPSVINDPNTLEIFSFDIANPRLILNFSVRKNPGILNINDIPDVRLREDKTRGYTEFSLLEDRQSGLSFETGGDKPEKTGFFLIKGIIYTISVQGNDLKSIDGLFEKITSTLHFL